MKLFCAVILAIAVAVAARAEEATTNSTAVKTSVVIALDAGTVTVPLVWTNGCLGQPETTDLADGGKAVYNFTITNEGDYVIAAQVSAPGEDANSFYVNVDAQPEDPATIWDIVEVTEGFQERIVSWRGNGDADKDEIAPKKFHLSPGLHKLIIVGREPAQLKGLTFRLP